MLRITIGVKLSSLLACPNKSCCLEMVCCTWHNIDNIKHKTTSLLIQTIYMLLHDVVAFNLYIFLPIFPLTLLLKIDFKRCMSSPSCGLLFLSIFIFAAKLVILYFSAWMLNKVRQDRMSVFRGGRGSPLKDCLSILHIPTLEVRSSLPSNLTENRKEKQIF